MDKIDKLVATTKKTGLQGVSAAEDRDSTELALSNRKLQTTLNSLLSSAQQNQATQERFFELELYFLQSASYEDLLGRILIDMKKRLNLSQVELLLLDSGQDIRQLILEIYGQLEFSNLIYIDSMLPITSSYGDEVKLTLTADAKIITPLFQSTNGHSESVAMLPLTRGKKIVGSLHLGSNDPDRFKAGLATNFLEHLGLIISVCIENSINQERYKHLSLVDLLTRVKNRRYFFQALAREIARASRSQRSLACLFIDIDHFKSINDTRGHLTGDRALCQVAKAIQPQLRQSDLLARFGGEEFTVLLPDCALAQAAEIAERIRCCVAALELKDEQNQTFQLTISIGVSHWSLSRSELREPASVQQYLLNQADKGVYQAKSTGRNCVQIAAD